MFYEYALRRFRREWALLVGANGEILQQNPESSTGSTDMPPFNDPMYFNPVKRRSLRKNKGCPPESKFRGIPSSVVGQVLCHERKNARAPISVVPGTNEGLYTVDHVLCMTLHMEHPTDVSFVYHVVYRGYAGIYDVENDRLSKEWKRAFEQHFLRNYRAPSESDRLIPEESEIVCIWYRWDGTVGYVLKAADGDISMHNETDVPRVRRTTFDFLRTHWQI